MTRRGQVRTWEGAICLIGFIASIWFANWLVTHWGTDRFSGGPWLIPVWPSELTVSGNPIYAPSGVLAIGVGFTLRDLVQRRLGVRVALLAIVIGAALSAALDTSLALASGVAFLLAETLDLFVYTPLQRRHLMIAVVASNVVGLVADSVVFLTIAFGSLSLLEGQIIGKAWMTLVAVPAVYGIRQWDQRRGLMPYDTEPALS
jgi:queuosine precursor transporter